MCMLVWERRQRGVIWKGTPELVPAEGPVHRLVLRSVSIEAERTGSVHRVCSLLWCTRVCVEGECVTLVADDTVSVCVSVCVVVICMW